MPFQIIRNDITKVKADAIVNTANPRPVVGGGTDYAIHTAAGPELLEARQEIGDIMLGCSVATPAFRLPAKYVLHTVSPAWIDGAHDEELLLRRAYDAALQLAVELGCRSVAFPLMAAGTYAFPHDLALSIAIGAFTDFLLEHEMRIDLVLFNTEAFRLAGSLFSDLKSFIDDNYVDERHEEEYRIDGVNRPNRRSRYLEQELRTRRKWERYHDAAEPSLNASMPAMPYIAAKPASAAPSMSLDDYLGQSEKTFSQHLLDLLIESNEKNSTIYKRAEVSKQLFSKILKSPDYQPSKSTAIQLAIGLQLDLPQTQKLLEKAGYALTRSSKADLVVQYYIEKKEYSIPLINTALYDSNLPLLSTGLAV